MAEGPAGRDDCPYPALFAPLCLAGRRLRNRIVHASISTKMARGQRTTPELLDYYRNRARGGAAMIVTEPLSVLPWHHLGHKVQVFGPHSHEDLSAWAESVESLDCRLLAQLQDPGRGRHSPIRNPEARGPSALPDDLSWTVPHVLSTEEVEQVVERMIESADRLRRAGFSGVELSAGHGHLFHQFLSPWSNRREDRYGGELENRTRLVSEISAGIRSRCGGSFIIGLKLPGFDGVPGSIDLEEAARLTQRLAQPGVVDYVCHAQGSHSDSLHLHLPDMHGSRCPYLSVTQRLRNSTNGVPVMALGLITDPAEGERIVTSGIAELVGLGRALIADPAWPQKAAEGRAIDIRYCVACNSCWGMTAEQGKPVACDNNPRVGRAEEIDGHRIRASRARKVVVVGAGPAGLEAAWIAGARGHRVTLFGASREVGGKLRLRAQLPGGENLSSVYDYQHAMARRYRVRLELGVPASRHDVETVGPDMLIIATGAAMAWPDELNPEYRDAGAIRDLRDTMPEFLHRTGRESGTAIVFDRDHTSGTYAAVERLADVFDRVVLVTPRDSLAQGEPLVTRQALYKRLAGKRVEAMLLTVPVANRTLDEGILTLQHRYSDALTRVDEVALVTYANYRVPHAEALTELTQGAWQSHVIGDAYAPQPLMAATRSGDRVASGL